MTKSCKYCSAKNVNSDHRCKHHRSHVQVLWEGKIPKEGVDIVKILTSEQVLVSYRDGDRWEDSNIPNST